MSDLIEAAKAKATATIEKAIAEQGILDILPKGLKAEPRVMIFKGDPHITYRNAPSLSEVLAIFDAFTVQPGYDCTGTFRGVYESKRDKVLGTYQAWVKLQAAENTGSGAKFCFFAKLSNGQTAQVSVDFDSSTYARKYQGQAWSADLGYTFGIERDGRGRKVGYYASGGNVIAHCAASCSYSTGRRDGGARCVYGFFDDRQQLAGAIDELVLSEVEGGV